MFREDDILKGLLAFSPLVMSVTSLCFGFKLGLAIVIFIFILAPVVCFSRKLLLLSQQQLVFILVVSISILSVARMLLEAEAYSFVEETGLFLPLLLLNSLVLSVCASIFKVADYKTIIHSVFKVAFASLLFFVVFGYLNEMLKEISFLVSAAGFLFISGFLFAAISYLKVKTLNKNRVTDIE